MKIALTPVSIILCLALIACSRTAGESSPAAELGTGLSLRLLAPATLGKTIVAVQSLELAADGKTQTFISQLEVDEERLAVALFVALGPRVMSAALEKGSVHYERSPYLPLPIEPAQLLFYLQLIYWPAETLREHYGKQIVIEDVSAPAQQRIIRREGRPLLNITYENTDSWRGKASLEAANKSFILRVDTLSFSEK